MLPIVLNMRMASELTTDWSFFVSIYTIYKWRIVCMLVADLPCKTVYYARWKTVFTRLTSISLVCNKWILLYICVYLIFDYAIHVWSFCYTMILFSDLFYFSFDIIDELPRYVILTLGSCKPPSLYACRQCPK